MIAIPLAFAATRLLAASPDCLALVHAALALCSLLLARSAPRIGAADRRARGAAARAAPRAIGAAILLEPSYVRNLDISGAWLLSTKGAWNLWKDNNAFPIVNHDWCEPEAMTEIHRWLPIYRAWARLGRSGRPAARRSRSSTPASSAPRSRTSLHRRCASPSARSPRTRTSGLRTTTPSTARRRARAPGTRLPRRAARFAALCAPALWVTALYLAAMLLFFVGITEPVAGAAAAPHRTVQVLVAAISRSWRWW